MKVGASGGRKPPAPFPEGKGVNFGLASCAFADVKEAGRTFTPFPSGKGAGGLGCLFFAHATSNWSHTTKLAAWRGPASMCWMPRRYVMSFWRAVSPRPLARNSITPIRATIQSGK